MVLGALPHLAAGRPAGLTGIASRLVAVAVVAAAFRPLSRNVTITAPKDWWVALAAMAGLLVAGWLIECLIRSLISADALRARFGVVLWDEMRVQLPLGVAVAATAILIAFAADMMGLLALGPVHRAAAGHPGRLPPLRRDPRHLSADRPGAGQGDRGRRVRGGRACPPGRPARRGRGPRPGDGRAGAARAGVRGAHARHRAALPARSHSRRGDRAGVPRQTSGASRSWARA